VIANSHIPFFGLRISNFFSWQIVLLDETLILVKFKDEHWHDSGDARGWKWCFPLRVYYIRKNAWLKF